MFFGNIIERIRLLDTESLVLALLLLITSRLASLFSQNQMLILIAAISAFSITLLLGAKLSKLFVSHIKYENSSLLIIALTPFFGLGFVYLTWMITASFSSFAPIVVTSLSFFCLLFTPSLHIRRIFLQKMRLSNIESSRKILPYIVILIIQLILMLATSIALTGIGNNIWLRTIYDGFPLWGYVCIFVVIGITFFLSLAGSKFWFISITAVGIWARTFMLSAGFVHFGGDDGENIAIVKMLANGNITPFLNLSENLSNWRYGSFQTLSFHSNMAFTSSLANLNPDFSAGALAVAVSTLLLVIGAYALSRTILNNSRAYRLAILFIMIFSPAAMWWQFRFDPNLLVSVLFPAYLAVVLLLPYSKSGLVLFLFSTFFLFSVHPLSLALILPCAIYKIAVFLLEVKKNIKISAAKSGILLILFMIVALILLLVPNLFIGVLRLFSATGFFGLSPGSGLQIGNYVSQSSLLNSYYPTYTLSFLSVVFGIISFVVFWKILKNDFSKKIKASILISSTIVIELLVLDFFLQPSDSFPAYRLWTVIPTIFAPITASLIVFLKYLPVSSFKTFNFSSKICSMEINSCGSFRFDYNGIFRPKRLSNRTIT